MKWAISPHGDSGPLEDTPQIVHQNKHHEQGNRDWIKRAEEFGHAGVEEHAADAQQHHRDPEGDGEIAARFHRVIRAAAPTDAIIVCVRKDEQAREDREEGSQRVDRLVDRHLLIGCDQISDVILILAVTTVFGYAAVDLLAFPLVRHANPKDDRKDKDHRHTRP